MKKMLISVLLGMVAGPLLAGITIQTSGSPTFPMGGKFYGYRSSGNGPGDTAFDEARALAVQHHVLLFIVWGRDGCATCSQYISNLDEWSRAAPKMLSYKNSVNAYFRGQADKPVACKACYDFLCNTVGASGSCHIMAAYGVAEDGAIYSKWCSLITDYATSGKKKVAWCDEFEKFKEKHKYTPPKASAAFACGSAAGARLEATMETERIFVPFVRTNCLDKAEHNVLRAWFANGQKVDVNLDWSIGQERAEVDFYMTGRYQADTKIQLGLVSTNGIEIATNYIYCVDSKANSFAYPRYVGETNGYAFGEWTLDLATATNAVWMANGYCVPVTNDARVVDVDHVFAQTLVNRRNVTVYTNGVDAIEIKAEEEEPATWPNGVAGAPYTNFTWTVEKKGGDPKATELVTNAISFVETRTTFQYAITNVYTYVSTNAAHQTHGEQLSEDRPPAEYNFVKKDQDTYYDVDLLERQHGYEPETSEQSEIQSATLMVTGSPVWDAKSIAFKSVFDSDTFKDWCVSNKVATVLVETKERDTGASLFSHKIAGNKTSGTPFISSKGFSVLDDEWNPKGEEIPVGGEFKIELIRPDGTVAGRLTPQFYADGTCDVEENLTRLCDLLELVEDRAEIRNDDPKTTALEIEYDKDYDIASMSEEELRKLLGEKMQTLMVSDKIDTFTLKGVPANTPFTVGYKNWKLSSVEPTLTVCAWNDAEKTGYTTLTTNLASGVYTATAAQIQNGLFLKAEAWTSDSAGTGTFADRTWCYYIPTALAAPETPGVIGFAGELDQTVRVAGEETVYMKVSRSGYTGTATATVRLDAEKTQLPAECFSWANEGGVTNLTWAALESGEKTIPVVLRNVTWLQDVSNLVFTVEASGAGLNVNAATNTFAITQEIDPDAPTGRIRLSAPTSDATIYVFGGQRDSLTLTIEREKIWYEDKDIWVARGAATGTVTAAGCTFDPSEKIEWDAYVSGSKNVTVTFPKLENKVSSKTVKVSVAGKDCDGADITVAGSNGVTVCVLPWDSCDFTKDIIVNDAVQHVALEPQYALLRDWSEGLELVSVSKISGSLPAGVSVKLIAEDINPGFLVSGTPTKPGRYDALYWMKLRRKSDKTTLMTKPCKVSIVVKSLGDDPETGDEGLIPGFESARAWTGLPLICTNTTRLAGLLDMTVAKNGRTTAKWRKAGGKTVSFSAASLTGCVQEAGVTNVYVEATKTQSKIANEFNVTFGADGTIDGSVVERDGAGTVVTEATFEVPAAEVWSKEHTAEAWEGNYTLAFPHDSAFEFNGNTLCTGATSLRVKFASDAQFKTGKATFAGYLPNGRGVSGTAAFVPVAEEAEVATLPIFYSTAADTFGALIDVGAADAPERVPPVSVSEEATNFWQHVESGLPGASYENDYTAVGTRYEADNWEESWGEAYKTNALCFALNCKDVGARIAAKGATLKVAEKGELKALAFALNKTSGEARGTFRDCNDIDREPIAEGKAATWRGVALPGCSAFTTGAYWYTTVFAYEDANGNPKKRSVKAGGAVSLEPPLED